MLERGSLGTCIKLAELLFQTCVCAHVRDRVLEREHAQERERESTLERARCLLALKSSWVIYLSICAIAPNAYYYLSPTDWFLHIWLVWGIPSLSRLLCFMSMPNGLYRYAYNQTICLFQMFQKESVGFDPFHLTSFV